VKFSFIGRPSSIAPKVADWLEKPRPRTIRSAICRELNSRRQDEELAATETGTTANPHRPHSMPIPYPSRHRALSWRFEQFHARLGAARLNVMTSYPEPPFVSNETGRPSSRFGALSQIVSVSPSKT
jgi:hypothetical protein